MKCKLCDNEITIKAYYIGHRVEEDGYLVVKFYHYCPDCFKTRKEEIYGENMPDEYKDEK